MRGMIPNCSFHHMRVIKINDDCTLTKMKLSIPVDKVIIDTLNTFNLIIERNVKSLSINKSQLLHTFFGDYVTSLNVKHLAK